MLFTKLWELNCSLRFCESKNFSAAFLNEKQNKKKIFFLLPFPFFIFFSGLFFIFFRTLYNRAHARVRNFKNFKYYINISKKQIFKYYKFLYSIRVCVRTRIYSIFFLNYPKIQKSRKTPILTRARGSLYKNFLSRFLASKYFFCKILIHDEFKKLKGVGCGN